MMTESSATGTSRLEMIPLPGSKATPGGLQGDTCAPDWFLLAKAEVQPGKTLRLSMRLSGEVPKSGWRAKVRPRGMIQVKSTADVLLGIAIITDTDIRAERLEFTFDGPLSADNSGIAVQIRSFARTDFAVTDIELSQVGSGAAGGSDRHPAFVIEPGKNDPIAYFKDWLPALSVGSAGSWEDGAIVAEAGKVGHIAYGPYWTLSRGLYRVTVSLEAADTAGSLGDVLCVIEAVTGDHYLTQFEVNRRDAREPVQEFDFAIRGWTRLDAVEIRTWSSGKGRFRITSLAVARIS